MLAASFTIAGTNAHSSSTTTPSRIIIDLPNLCLFRLNPPPAVAAHAVRPPVEWHPTAALEGLQKVFAIEAQGTASVYDLLHDIGQFILREGGAKHLSHRRLQPSRAIDR